MCHCPNGPNSCNSPNRPSCFEGHNGPNSPSSPEGPSGPNGPNSLNDPNGPNSPNSPNGPSKREDPQSLNGPNGPNGPIKGWGGTFWCSFFTFFFCLTRPPQLWSYTISFEHPLFFTVLFLEVPAAPYDCRLFTASARKLIVLDVDRWVGNISSMCRTHTRWSSRY